MTKPINLSENLDKLHEIAKWFDEQSQVDVEEGLKKVKEAASLIKESKARLQEIENEFREIQSDIVIDQTTSEEVVIESVSSVKVTHTDEELVDPDDIPF